MDDHEIIGLFHARSERAIDATSEKYGKLCLQIALGIVATEADAAECVNDAYLALWNNIPPEKPASLRAYVTRLVRNISYDRRDRQIADRRDSRLDVSLQELIGMLPESRGPEEALDSALIRDALNQFLRSLHKKDQFLFLRRYYYLNTCREIAGMTGMNESTVSTKLGRLRQKLKAILIKEGIDL